MLRANYCVPRGFPPESLMKRKHTYFLWFFDEFSADQGPKWGPSGGPRILCRLPGASPRGPREIDTAPKGPPRPPKEPQGPPEEHRAAPQGVLLATENGECFLRGSGGPPGGLLGPFRRPWEAPKVASRSQKQWKSLCETKRALFGRILQEKNEAIFEAPSVNK